MNVDESITRWIGQLKEGESLAAQKLWESYFERMVQLARRKLQGTRRAVADEEDVALSAFKSFCGGLQKDRFSKLTDRSNLWPLLVAITANKSREHLRRQNRLKRGGTGRAVDSDADESRARYADVELGEVIGNSPTPEFVVEVAEELQRLMERLDESGDPLLRTVAEMRMNGDSAAEIADQVGCVRRTVERKLKLVASLWSDGQRA